MTTDTITYPDETSWRDALDNGRRNWKILTNSRLALKITWNNDPPVIIPPKNMTQRAFIDLLAAERNVNIT